MNLGIEGKRAAVAAASTGLGFASAQALAMEGAVVAICGRDRSRIDDAARRIGPSAVPLVVDVSNAEGGESFIEKSTAALGGTPEILVANAGGPARSTFETAGIEDYQQALQLNLMSTIGMCRAAMPAMQAAKWGRVVAITSVVVKQPLPYLILSNTARAGVHGFLKTMSAAVAADGVTVNAAMPGGHATHRQLQLYTDVDAVEASIPARRLGLPSEFGATVAFLCSQQAAYITGSSLAIDGGASTSLL